MSTRLGQVLEQADALARELMRLREQARLGGHMDTQERIDLELAGYGPGRAVPRYRHVAADHRGDMQDAQLRRDVPLPVAHLSFGKRAVIREGLLHLREIAGFSEAFDAGAHAIKRPIEPGLLPVYARGLAPGSGIRIERGWECISAASLEQMLQATRDYLHAMRS